MAVSRHREFKCEYTREFSLPNSIARASLAYYSSDFDAEQLVQYDMLGNNHLIQTPPQSPVRDDEEEECFSTTPLLSDSDNEVHQPMPTSDMFYKEFQSRMILQDCMWSGIEKRETVSRRTRNVSMSELQMVSASTSCVDPTTFTAYPRQQSQIEHNYSLATPEPMRVPKLHSYSTPVSTDDSESEEDLIDVVTVDTRAHTSSSSNATKYSSKASRVKSNLQAVAKKLNSQSYKRPKCMSELDFVLPGKKARQYLSSQTSLTNSGSCSENEEFEGKRSAHNVMERQRRNDLKNSLHDLRDILPSLATQERAPKVVILSHATQYVQELREDEQALAEEHRNIKAENLRLRERLDSLMSFNSYY